MPVTYSTQDVPWSKQCTIDPSGGQRRFYKAYEMAWDSFVLTTAICHRARWDKSFSMERVFSTKGIFMACSPKEVTKTALLFYTAYRDTVKWQ